MFLNFPIVLCTVLFLSLKVLCDEPDPKSSIVFVIDKTLSMGPVIDVVKSEVNAIFDTVTSSPKSPITNYVLVSFADPNVSDVLVTTEREEFKKELQSIKLEDGADCAELAMKGMKKALDASLPGSYIYVFTDASAKDFDKFEEVKKIAQKKECQVVFILTGSCCDRTELSEDYAVYPKLAEATSGQVFNTVLVPDINKICSKNAFMKPVHRSKVEHHTTERAVKIPLRSFTLSTRINNLNDRPHWKRFCTIPLLQEGNLSSEILTYVKHSITSRRIILFAKKYPLGKKDYTFEIESDSKTKDLTVSITAAVKTNSAYIEATIYGPDDDTIDEDALVRMGDILILKVSESTPGMYKVDFSSDVASYVVVTAGSDVRFRHGFSTKMETSLDDTVFSPFSATKNYLFIKLFGEDVTLLSVKLLDPNYHNLLELPLTQINDTQKLYVTELFDSPSTKFRIAVKGVINSKRESITRFGNLVIETEKFKEKSPKVNIKSETKIIVDYNVKLLLNCTVEGYPEPEIVWKDLDDRRELPSLLGQTPPYNFYRVVELVHLKKNKTLECYAVNRLGTDSKKLQIEVKPEPYIEFQGPKNVALDYGAKGVLHCKVKAFPPAKIFWLLDKQKTALEKLGKIVLSPDNSTLTIKYMTRQLDGKYRCQVKHRDRFYVQSARITLSARAPKLEGPPYHEIFLREKEDVKLTCSLLEGKPKPDIKWFRKLALDPKAKFEELKENKNKISLSIENANIYRSGIYKCSARNVMGLNTREINLYVQSKPTVTLDSTREIVKKNTELNIKCTVVGVPTPKVTWLRNETLLEKDADNNIIVFRDNRLRIKKIKVNHTGLYTCRAQNKVGLASGSVNVTVYSLDVTPPSKTKFTYNLGERRSLTLRCKDFVTGVPEPTITWMFYSFDKTVPPKKLVQGMKGPFTVTKDRLKIKKNMKIQYRGDYVCLASNIGDSKNITFELNVLFGPKILNEKSQLQYKAVKGDRLLKIFCNATGNPEPTVSWIRNGFRVAAIPNQISFDKSWLLIQQVDISDAGKYQCEAQVKSFKSVTKQFQVIVEEFPPVESIKNTTNIFIAQGSRSRIRCFLPHTMVDTVNWYKDKKLIDYKGEFELRNAKPTDAGVYTCRVNKDDTPVIETANTHVIVGLKPTFVNNPPSKVEMYSREDVSLDCLISIESKSSVTWWHNGKIITFSGMYYNFKMDYDTIGKFKCEASNTFGKVQRIFDIVRKDFSECVLQIDNNPDNQPLITTTSHEWPKFITANGFTTIPKLQEIVFFCPMNFAAFEETSLTAICYGETKFYTKEKVLDYAAIKCKQDIIPTFIMPKGDRNESIPCRGGKTATAKIMFGKEHNTIEAIEYCLDRQRNPIYAKYNMNVPAGYIPKNNTMWDGTNMDSYRCDKQRTRLTIDTSRCCFAKRQLVNPRDVFAGPLQRATYNRLNYVPHWSTCHSENWDALEENVRRLAQTVNNDLIIYTGTAEKLIVNNTYGDMIEVSLNKHHNIARNLWKVVQYPAGCSSVAIIQLNIPEVLRSQLYEHVRCTDICYKLRWLKGTTWGQAERGYTYCCELKEFIRKFRLSAIPFMPYFDLLIG